MAAHLCIFWIVLCITNIGVHSTNDTAITKEETKLSPNQVIISTQIFHLLIGISLSVIVCLGCILMCGCAVIFYHYKYKYKPSTQKAQNTYTHAHIELQQIKSNSQTSNPSLPNHQLSFDNIDSYLETESIATRTKSKSKSKNIVPIYHRAQSVPIHRIQNNANNSDLVRLSDEGSHDSDCNECIDKPRRKRFNSEELYVDNTRHKSLESHTKTPFAQTTKGAYNASNDDCKSDTTSTFTVTENMRNYAKSNGLEGSKIGKILNISTMNSSENERSKSESVYTMDGHNRSQNVTRRNTIGSALSEGDKSTENECGQFMQEWNALHKTHIPDIREESDLDMTVDDECKSIHHDTVRKHKQRFAHNKALLNVPSVRSNNSEIASVASVASDEQVLLGISDENTPKGNESPFNNTQTHKSVIHYHTEPSLKYGAKLHSNNNSKLLQPPFIVDDTKIKPPPTFVRVQK